MPVGTAQNFIGDDRHWRVNVADGLKLGKEKRKTTPWRSSAEILRRPIIVVGRNGTTTDIDDSLGVQRGFRVRLCIEAEKELQFSGVAGGSSSVSYAATKCFCTTTATPRR